MERKLNNDGVTLVELMIAVAISAIIASALIIFINYSSESMTRTQAKVALQNEAKDMVNHIGGVAMEADSAEWREDISPHALVLKNDSAADPKRVETVYWKSGSKMFFASTDDVSLDSLPADDNYLLGEQIADFKCEIVENEQSKEKTVKFEIKLKNEKADFICNNEIYLRNQ